METTNTHEEKIDLSETEMLEDEISKQNKRIKKFGNADQVRRKSGQGT